MNLGTPVVVSKPKSAVAGQFQELSLLYAPVTPDGTEGVAAMSVSERILQAQQAAMQRGEVANAWRQAPGAAPHRRRVG